MALNDIIATAGGNPFQESFLRASANRRAQEAHQMASTMNLQKMQQNEMALQQQQMQMDTIKRRQEAIKTYQGNKKGLVDTLFNEGDIEGASNIVAFEKQIAGLSKAEQDAAEQKVHTMSAALIEPSGAVLEAFKRDPRQGAELALQVGNELAQQYPELGQKIPDFRSMPPEEVQRWWANQYNRSSKNLQFEETKRKNKALEAAKMKESANIAWKREKEQAIQKRFEKTYGFKVDKQGFVKDKDLRKATTGFRKEAASDVKNLTEMDEMIDIGLEGLRTGGSLGSKAVKVALSKLANSKVRALAELQEYKSFGPLQTRIAGRISQFISGDMSTGQKQEAFEFFTNMRENYVRPGVEASKGFYRSLARRNNIDPQEVAPYESPQEVKADYDKKLLTQDQARKILLDNPNWILK